MVSSLLVTSSSGNVNSGSNKIVFDVSASLTS